MSIDLTTLSTREVLSAVYIGYYNRAADPAGIQFWEQVIANTSLDLEAVATDFAGQAETQSVHPFFADPATSTPSTFITSLYQNLFNRDPDDAGLEFWSEQLQNAIDGVEGSFSVGEIIVKIIEGAVDVASGTQDRTTILNKIEVAQDWTDAAEADGGEFDAAAMASAKAIIADVTSDQATVVSAKEATDAFFAPAPVPGETLSLTSATDVMAGTANDDQFNAYIQQNPFAGGVSNSLSSADRLDGGAGNDRLYAEITGEFVGVVGNVSNIDIQPRLSGIEEIDIEARESTFLTTEFLTGGPVVVDAKNITDHVEIGSYFSDGDLKIENLTTLTAGGDARNTSDITVTMDHTDNFNTDGDASDLEVLFDNDYLLSGQTSEGIAEYFLLDEKAELIRLDGGAVDGRLDEIDKNGIRFEINGEVVVVAFDEALLVEDGAGEVNTHDMFIAALQAPLNALIASGDLPAGTTIEKFEYPSVVTDSSGKTLNRTGLNDGSLSDLIPAIRVTSGDGSPITPLGFAAPAEITGAFDVFGEFRNEFEQQEEPISVDIDLHKVGRGGQGGDLVVGGKSDNTEDGIADGIEVFNISVKGAGAEDADGAPAKPSSLGTVTSTGNELEVVNIATDAAFKNGASFASLTIRNGFNELDGDSAAGRESGDLKMVNANSFLGDLTLGTADVATGTVGTGDTGSQRIINADSIMAMGGGDVTLNAFYTGTEDNQEYTVNTGSGDDSFNILIDGDAVDAVTEGFALNSGAGNDTAVIDVQASFGGQPTGTPGTPAVNSYGSANTSGQLDDDGVSLATTDRLLNLEVDTGAGDDSVEIRGLGNFDIETQSGSDFVYINAGGNVASGGLWNTSGASLFQPVVVYKAELAISVAGFESVVDIDTGDDFILTEQELNVAIIAAIEQNPEIAKLVTATIGTSDQNLIVQALIDGVNEVGFQIRQPELLATGPAAAGSAQIILNSGDVAGMTRDLLAVGAPDGTTFTTSTPIDTAAEIVGFFGDAGTPALVPTASSVADDLFGNTTGADGYTGQVTTYITAATGGSVGEVVNNSTINMGTGTNDLVVLSSNDDSATNQLSQNTLVFDDLNAGKTSIVNWFDNDTTANLISNGSATQANGNHLLDFTSLLTNQWTTSGSAESNVYEGIEVIAGTTMDANTMHFVDVDFVEANVTGTPNLSFDGINAAAVKALIEQAGGITYTAQPASTGTGSGLAVGTTERTSIIAIENVDVETGAGVLDNTNHGEYKFFLISYGLAAETATSTVRVEEITTLDFGDSIDTAAGATGLELNLVGSATITGNDFI